MSNPCWARDELILALDAYFKHPDARGNKTHPEVIKLTKVLNQPPIHPQAPRGVEFRNPNGVSMKLANFLRFDPDYTGAGLKACNKLEEVV
jgi:5-methylcytosine-specific restriction enzyme A